MRKRKISISPNSGFCFGVKRALDIASRALQEKGTIYSLGPIIHNPQVVSGFYGKGLKIIKDLTGVNAKKGHLLIPSHGASPETLKKGFSYIDTTCPLVGRVQKIVRDLKKKGYFIIIVGDKKHPEIKRIVTMINDTGQRYFSTPLCDVEKHLEIPERSHPMDDRTKSELDKYQPGWEIIE